MGYCCQSPQQPSSGLAMTELWELRLEAKQALEQLLHPSQDHEHLLDNFMRWILPRWDVFWARFHPDGTMAWREFEEFVRWTGKWHGDARKVFDLLDDDRQGCISTRACLEARRQFEGSKDLCHLGLDGLKRLLTGQFGTLARAWRCVLDPDETGRCCQATFLRECHAIGFRGSLKSTWAELTHGEVQRTICLRDLDAEGDRLLAKFAMALATEHGSLREGWHAIIRGGVGRLDVHEFTDTCRELGIGARDAKKLFTCLDPQAIGSLGEDKYKFLTFWDPSEAGSFAHTATTAAATGLGKGEMQSKSQSPPRRPGDGVVPRTAGVLGVDAPTQPFEFVVVLTKEEYSEYLRRRRARRLVADNRAGGDPRGARPSPSPAGDSRDGQKMWRSGTPKTGASPVNYSKTAKTTAFNDTWSNLTGANAGGSSAGPTGEGTPGGSLGGLLQMTVPE